MLSALRPTFALRPATRAAAAFFSTSLSSASSSSSSSAAPNNTSTPSTPPSSTPATAQPDNAITQRAEGAIAQAGIVSGVPDELHRRPVRIYRPSAPTTQSAKATSHHWRIDWDILQGGGRWENPLMGWASSADYMQGTHVKFNTKEDAIHFCEKQGYGYYVQEPHAAKFKPKAYATNYLYTNKAIRWAHTK